ncbi:carboxynorspermidine decarboxylase [Catalinimonas alkaloidigena]|uniref:Carboxynorspermidine/carboxyspermidine decarboxylase n=1 Tax=Catalinimonas alkaloidigena TaxID=1075417 RepID=A0A1G9BE35_9BACT|nr:carboxynorspermidine decarboxylase [Catalinimonas alkaloidigena]SDK37733.1 carboxynorspermidine decarboxylase [Catalinimonas alkaloidigena]
MQKTPLALQRTYPTVDFQAIPSACFVLEEKRLRENLELIKFVQEESGAQIILALKGFAMFGAFPLIRKYLSGTASSGLYEARLGYEEFGGEVHCFSTAYFEDEFEDILRYSDHLSFNSLNQWERFKPRVQHASKKISCAIRINPEYAEVTTDLYNPCIPGSRLGQTAPHFGDQLPEGIEGLHFHTLCESDSYALERTLAAIEDRFGKLLHQAKWVNMGGGHLMTREGYDVAHLIRVLKQFQEKYDVKVILEPGAAIAWQTGYLVTTVQDIFDSQGIQAVIIDASISAHMPDCIEMPYKPKILGAYDAVPTATAYRIGGSTCLAGDYVGDYRFDRPLQIGNRLVFDDMMHYTMVKTTFFNGVRHPSLGIWHEDGSFELVRKFSYEDYRSKLS